MRSILASKRLHPSYQIPDPISHVHILSPDTHPDDEGDLADVVDFAAARARLRPAT